MTGTVRMEAQAGSDKQGDSERLSLGTKVLYGVADCGAAMLTALVRIFLLQFYTDVLHIDPWLAGTALFAGKLTWDAINDPLIGYLSDRTRTRIGRRRPYMLAAAIPVGLALWLLYSIPAGLGGLAAFVAIVGSFLLLDTMHTLFHVPYVSLTPELTHDYQERTALTTVRMVFATLGNLSAASIVLLLSWFQGLGWTEKASYSGVGAVFGMMVTATMLTTALGVRERKGEFEPSATPPLRAWLQSFRDLPSARRAMVASVRALAFALSTSLRNVPFVRLIGAYLLNSVAFALLNSLLPYFVVHQMDMEAQIPTIMAAMVTTIAASLYLYKWLSDRINKGPAYALGLGIACLAVAATFALPAGPTPVIYVIAIVAGMGFSANFVCPWSMLPDVIEYDELETGERREGVYYGMWAFSAKLADALGIAVSGWSLSLFGYDEMLAAQSGTTLFGMRLFFGIVPVVLIGAALPMLIRYPITRASHAEVRAQLGALSPGAE